VCFRLSRLLVGFQMHLKSMQFYFISYFVSHCVPSTTSWWLTVFFDGERARYLLSRNHCSYDPFSKRWLVRQFHIHVDQTFKTSHCCCHERLKIRSSDIQRSLLDYAGSLGKKRKVVQWWTASGRLTATNGRSCYSLKQWLTPQQSCGTKLCHVIDFLNYS